MEGFHNNLVSEPEILNMAKGMSDYKRLELMLKENDKKWEKNLLKVERIIDVALEEIKSLINGMTLQYKEIKN